MKQMMAAAMMAATVFSFSAAQAKQGRAVTTKEQNKTEIKKSPAQTKMENARAERIGKKVDKTKAADATQKNDAKKLHVKKK